MGVADTKKSKDASATKGLRFQKSFGQHILKNPLIINTMIEKAAIKPSDTVFEVGPGTGNLTCKLLECCQRVIAFEIDPRMVTELQKRFQGTSGKSKLKILVGDCIKCEEWPKFDLCVANLPYQISSPFFLRLINLQNSYRCAVVMVQKEFADRLVAKPGDKLYCRLSANIQFHCKVAKLMKISRNSFRPPPKVDSAVVRVEPRHPKPPVTFEEWDYLLRIIFTRKNKTLYANFNKSIIAHLRKIYLENCRLRGVSPEPIGIKDDETGITLMEQKILQIISKNNYTKFRARTMDEDDLLGLLVAFKKEGINFH